MGMVNKIVELAYHRNGVGGKGFYAIRFQGDIEGGSKDANFLAIVTQDPGECYVTCLDLIPTCGVKFAGGNSWRGDEYESQLRRAIEAKDAEPLTRRG